MTAFPDAWTQFYLIGIIPEDGSGEIQFAGFTEELNFDLMEKPMESIELANGGHVVKKNASGAESVTLKLYPVKADLTAEGAVQFFHRQATDDAVQPILVNNTNTRKKHGIIILWSEKLPATAGAVPDTGYPSYRFQAVNAYMTTYKPNYDDKIFNVEVTFSWAPFTKAAVENKREESCDDSAPLPAAITSATSFS